MSIQELQNLYNSESSQYHRKDDKYISLIHCKIIYGIGSMLKHYHKKDKEEFMIAYKEVLKNLFIKCLIFEEPPKWNYDIEMLQPINNYENDKLIIYVIDWLEGYLKIQHHKSEPLTLNQIVIKLWT